MECISGLSIYFILIDLKVPPAMIQGFYLVPETAETYTSEAMKTPRINTRLVRNYLQVFLVRSLKEAGASRLVIGISGGLDSATAAFLAREALSRDQIQALILPYGSGQAQDIADAMEVCRRLKIPRRVIELDPMIDAYFSRFPRASARRRGNKMARERMSILYDWAAAHDGLVLGTSNRTELLLGYFTKFGDGAADLEPLGGLYKCEVRQLANDLGVPDAILEKSPAAGLWKGQTDEKEIGLPYSVLDSLLHLWLDRVYDHRRLRAEGFSRETIRKVQGMVRLAGHKLRLPPCPAIQLKWRKTVA